MHEWLIWIEAFLVLICVTLIVERKVPKFLLSIWQTQLLIILWGSFVIFGLSRLMFSIF